MKSRKIETIEDEQKQTTCSVWGLNDCGQLFNNECRILKRPTVIHCSTGIFGFASGDFHTLLISDALKLYSAGLNIYGQLGVSTTALQGPTSHELLEITVAYRYNTNNRH